MTVLFLAGTFDRGVRSLLQETYKNRLCLERAQNPGHTLALSDTCVAAVGAANSPFHVLKLTGSCLPFTQVAALLQHYSTPTLGLYLQAVFGRCLQAKLGCRLVWGECLCRLVTYFLC